MEFLFLLVLCNRWCVQKNYSTGDKILWLNLIGLLCVITNFQISVESALMDEWLGQSQYSSFLELDALFAGMTMVKEMVNHNLGWEWPRFEWVWILALLCVYFMAWANYFLSLWLKFCPVKSNKLIRVKPRNGAKHAVTASRCSPVLLSWSSSPDNKLSA